MEELRRCSWCGLAMGNSWHKSANGNYFHMKCAKNFKSYFKAKSIQISDKKGEIAK